MEEPGGASGHLTPRAPSSSGTGLWPSILRFGKYLKKDFYIYVAMSLLDESLAISSELGMRPLVERVLSRRDILKA